MSSNNKPVRFIRKRGRIIPIFSKKKKRDLKEGALTLSSGVAISASGAAASGFAAKKFFSIKNKREIVLANAMATLSPRLKFSSDGIKSVGRTRLPTIPTLKAFGVTNRQVKRMGKFAKISRGTFKFSRIGSAALVGLGTEKLLSASGFNESGLGSEIGSESVGVAAATLNELFSSRVVKKVAFNEPIFKGFKKGANKSFKSVGKTIFKAGSAILKRKAGIR